MKHYKISESGKLVLIGDDDEDKESKSHFESMQLRLKEKRELQTGNSKKDNRQQLKESFKQAHPEWTEKQLEIAVEGRN